MGMSKTVERTTEEQTGQKSMIRKIVALDLANKTFKCCTLTAEKNFQDRNITPGNMD